MSFYFAQFLTGLSSASSLFLVACGLSLIFGVTRVRRRIFGDDERRDARRGVDATTTRRRRARYCCIIITLCFAFANPRAVVRSPRRV